MAQVAVLIPVYNNPQGLEKTLCALVGAPVDTVVVDDGSSPPLVLPKAGACRATLIRLESNQGIARALNAGLEHICAQPYPFVARLDAGDTATADRFLKQRAYLEAHPACALVGSHVLYTAMDGTPLHVQYQPTDSAQIRRKMHLKNCFSHPAILMRTAVLEQIGRYSPDYPAAEDYDFFFRCVRHYETANLNEVLTTVEANPNGISIRNRKQQIRSCLKIQWHNFVPWRIESYIGVMRTCAHFVIPQRCLLLLKCLLRRPRHTEMQR